MSSILNQLHHIKIDRSKQTLVTKKEQVFLYIRNTVSHNVFKFNLCPPVLSVVVTTAVILSPGAVVVVADVVAVVVGGDVVLSVVDVEVAVVPESNKEICSNLIEF